MKPEDYVKKTNKSKFIRNYLENDKRLIRLFAVVCCYQIWDLIKDERSRKAVEVAELYADGLATEEEIQKVYSSADSASVAYADYADYAVADYSASDSASVAYADYADYAVADYSASAYYASASASAYYASASAASAAYAASAAAYAAYAASAASAAYAAAYAASAAYANVRDEMYLKQSIMLKNMKGNWDNSWNTSDVMSLAKTIYDKKQYSLMPILSDALQEAGCQDEEILNYCCNGIYFRGCWVLDKATGKR